MFNESHIKKYHSKLDVDVSTFLKLKEIHDKENPGDDSPYLPLNGLISSSFPIYYFGGQLRFYPFIKNIVLKICPDIKIYSDGTGGGIGVPYQFYLDGYNVQVSDISFLTYCWASYFLKRNDYFNFKCNRHMRYKGYIYTNREKFGFSDELSQFIDCLIIENKENYSFLGLLGFVMLKYFTYKNLCWDFYLVQLENVSSFLKKLMYEYNNFISEKINNNFPSLKDANVFHLDAFEFARQTEGDVIYTDFAWAWNDNFGDREVSEYFIPNRIISSFLNQCNFVYPTEVWTKENTIDLLKKYINIAVQNYKFLIINTQSTNYPIGEDLYFILKDIYNERIIDYFFFDAMSRTFTSSYREYFIILKGDKK